MFKNIFRTVFVKIFAAAISFLIVILNAKFIGAEGVGVISLIILDVSLIALVSGIIAGPSIVYYSSRKKISELYILSVLWIVLVIGLLILSNYLLSFFREMQDLVFPNGYFRDIVILSILQSIYGLNMSIVLGREKIKTHNIINLIQFLVLIVSVVLFFYLFNNTSVNAYLISYYIAILCAVILSFGFVIKTISKQGFSAKIKNAWIEVFNYGLFSQPASIFQLLNYRIPYYFLNKFVGMNRLGVYSTANQISEGLWLFSKSISMVQYSKISNSDDEDYNIELTVNLLKISLLITLVPLIILVCIPEKWILYVLSNNEFEGVKNVIYFLSPGILALVVKMIFAHYFSGIGLPKYNMYSSAYSLIFALISAFIFIPEYGIIGAAISASITYLSGAIIESYYFFKKTKLKFKDLYFRKSDLDYSMEVVKNILQK